MFLYLKFTKAVLHFTRYYQPIEVTHLIKPHVNKRTAAKLIKLVVVMQALERYEFSDPLSEGLVKERR